MSFCGGIDGDGHLFWDSTHPPMKHIREGPEFAHIAGCDLAHWNRCLLWHGWLPAPSACQGQGPWTSGAGDVAEYWLECALGPYSQ